MHISCSLRVNCIYKVKTCKTPLHLLLLLLWKKKNPKPHFGKRQRTETSHCERRNKTSYFCIFFYLNFYSHNFLICKKHIPLNKGNGRVEPSPILMVQARIIIGRTSLLEPQVQSLVKELDPTCHKTQWSQINKY